MIQFDLMLRQRVGSLHPADEEHNLSFGERTRSSVLEPQEFKQRLSPCSHHRAQVPWGFPQLKPEQTLYWMLRSWMSGGKIVMEWQPSVGCSLKFLLFNLATFVCLHLFVSSRDLFWLCLVFFWHHKYLCSLVYSYVHQSSWLRPVDLLMSILSQTVGSMFQGSSFSQAADHRSWTKIFPSGTEFFVLMQ